MFVKKHYSGLAISYSGGGGGRKSLTSVPGKKSDSRLNRQKRSIHDAVEWMRRNATYKPLIFCCTVPVQSDWSMQNTNVSKFCENIKSTYDVKNYVWVREYTGGGRPHYHFVADSPFMDALQLSLYWSELFSSSAVNSIRFGTYPSSGKVRYFVDSPRMARYLTKYMGKGIGDEEGRAFNKEKEALKKIRTFGHSNECWQKSQPVTYEVKYVREFSKQKNDFGFQVDLLDNIQRTFTLCENSERELIEVYGNVPDHLRKFDDSQFSWICPNPLHRVYYGIPKRMQRAKGIR